MQLRETDEAEQRRAIRAEVLAIEPFDDLEREHIMQVLSWIDSGVPLCRLHPPATPPVHLVAYFVCIDADSVLLVDHKRAQLWLPTGGHVEPGEHPRDTVRREIHEELETEAEFACESPLLLTVTQTVGPTASHTDVSLWYVLRLDRRALIPSATREFHSARWFAPHEVPFERTDPNMGRFLRKLAQHFPLR